MFEKWDINRAMEEWDDYVAWCEDEDLDTNDPAAEAGYEYYLWSQDGPIDNLEDGYDDYDDFGE